MPESGKRMAPSEAVASVANALTALAVIGGFVLYLTGGLSNTTIAAHDLALIKSQLGDVSVQVARLQDRLDNGPRLDQLRGIDQHLSALDGRMDGMDTRSRDIENRLTRAQTQLENIDVASRASLTGRK